MIQRRPVSSCLQRRGGVYLHSIQRERERVLCIYETNSNRSYRHPHTNQRPGIHDPRSQIILWDQDPGCGDLKFETGDHTTVYLAILRTRSPGISFSPRVAVALSSLSVFSVLCAISVDFLGVGSCFVLPTLWLTHSM